MNGKLYKKEIENIFKLVREDYPDITNDTLYCNGKVFYMNGNDSTPFDWNCNNRLCEFFVFHEDEMGFIKVCVNRDNLINVYVYEDGGLKPTSQFETQIKNIELEAQDFANLMNHIADKQNLYDKPIDELDWDIDTWKCENIDEDDENDDWEDSYWNS